MVDSYCTLPELKNSLGGISGSSQDTDLQLAIDAASRAIDDHCNRFFWQATQVRTYVPTSWRSLAVDDIVSVTALKTDAAGSGSYLTSWPASAYQLLPPNAPLGSEPRPYTEIRAVAGLTFPTAAVWLGRSDRVQVDGVFGWPAVPAAVHKAALILAVDMYKLKDAPFGVQAYGDYGIRVRDNPRVTALLAPYRKNPVLVA